jgi:hypothetical protein
VLGEGELRRFLRGEYLSVRVGKEGNHLSSAFSSGYTLGTRNDTPSSQYPLNRSRPFFVVSILVVGFQLKGNQSSPLMCFHYIL